MNTKLLLPFTLYSMAICSYAQHPLNADCATTLASYANKDHWIESEIVWLGPNFTIYGNPTTLYFYGPNISGSTTQIYSDRLAYSCNPDNSCGNIQPFDFDHPDSTFYRITLTGFVEYESLTWGDKGSFQGRCTPDGFIYGYKDGNLVSIKLKLGPRTL